MSEMHDVVEMLLNRIKDYPEDFVGDPADYRDMTENKWKKALRLVSGVVAPHEKEALDIRLEEARRAVYMGAALKVMLSPDEPVEEQKDLYRVQSNGNLIFGKQGAPVTLSTTSTNLTNAIQARQDMMNAYAQSCPISGSAIG